MTALDLGDVASSRSSSRPTRAAVRDGYLLLEELGAIDATANAAVDSRRSVDGWPDSRSIRGSDG